MLKGAKMNISPVKAYGAQNFTAGNHSQERLMGRQDSTYIHPNEETEPPKRHRNYTKQPECTKTVIHWMNYGDGVPVPVLVEVEE